MSHARSKGANEWAIAVVGVGVIVLGGWLVVNRGMPGTGLGDSGKAADSTAPSVVVHDQKAGDAVIVESVTVTSESWIAVRETGKAPHILGAARMATGTSESIAVPLLRGTVAGNTYEMVVYADDGDRQFDLHKDTPAAGVAASFKAL